MSKWPHYLSIYHEHFDRLRRTGRTLHVLEIGVLHGGSLQMWRDYFGPSAVIYGVDRKPSCKIMEREGFKIFVGDQADRSFWARFKEAVPRLDIVVDDGGHTMRQQIVSLEELYPFVSEDGVYLCEDVHTSYRNEYGGGLGRSGTFVEHCKGLVDGVNAHHTRGQRPPDEFTFATASITFHDSVVVFRKRPRDDQPPGSKVVGTISLR